VTSQSSLFDFRWNYCGLRLLFLKLYCLYDLLVITFSVYSLIMAALCNRTGHYIFALWFLSSIFYLLSSIFYLFFFPRL